MAEKKAVRWVGKRVVVMVEMSENMKAVERVSQMAENLAIATVFRMAVL